MPEQSNIRNSTVRFLIHVKRNLTVTQFVDESDTRFCNFFLDGRRRLDVKNFDYRLNYFAPFVLHLRINFCHSMLDVDDPEISDREQLPD